MPIRRVSSPPMVDPECPRAYVAIQGRPLIPFEHNHISRCNFHDTGLETIVPNNLIDFVKIRIGKMLGVIGQGLGASL